MTLLINKSDIENYRSCLLDVKEELLNPFIANAQDEDLRPILGNEMYFDVLKNENAKYDELLNGSTFIMNEIEFTHQGLKSVLADFAYGRFIIHGSFNVSNFGFIEKSSQDSKPVSTNHRRDIKKIAEQSAHSKLELVVLFMDFKGYSKKQTTKRRRIGKI